MARVVDPLIADLQHEHERAVRDGLLWRSRVVHIIGWIAFSKVLAICLWRDDLAPRNWTTEDRRMLVKALACSVVMIVVMTALFEISPIRTVRAVSGLRVSMWVLLLTLAPQALAVAVTLGSTFGIVYAIGGRAFSRRVAEAVVVLALVASALSFANVGWITPAANQAFRVAVSGRSNVAKGAPELTLGELSQAIETVRREPIEPAAWHFGNPPLYLKRLTLHYHTRWAVSFSPMVFACFTLSIAAGGFLRRWVLSIAVVAAFFVYYVLLFAGLGLGRPSDFVSSVPAYVSAWAPNVTVALIAACLALRNSRAGLDDESAR
jgi:hypothetical protein